MLSQLLSNSELWQYSIKPKADLTIKTHFACKNLVGIVDRIVGKEDE